VDSSAGHFPVAWRRLIGYPTEGVLLLTNGETGSCDDRPSIEADNGASIRS